LRTSASKFWSVNSCAINLTPISDVRSVPIPEVGTF